MKQSTLLSIKSVAKNQQMHKEEFLNYIRHPAGGGEDGMCL